MRGRASFRRLALSPGLCVLGLGKNDKDKDTPAASVNCFHLVPCRHRIRRRLIARWGDIVRLTQEEVGLPLDLCRRTGAPIGILCSRMTTSPPSSPPPCFFSSRLRTNDGGW